MGEGGDGVQFLEQQPEGPHVEPLEDVALGPWEQGGGGAEIAQHGVALRSVPQDVVGVEVTMAEAPCMQMGRARSHPVGEAQGRAGREA